jgi:hypothetical protein
VLLSQVELTPRSTLGDWVQDLGDVLPSIRPVLLPDEKLVVTVKGFLSTVVFTSCSVKFFVQSPVVPNRVRVDVTSREDVSTVCEPVRPVIVTVDPIPRLQFAVSVTVRVLSALVEGLLC